MSADETRPDETGPAVARADSVPDETGRAARELRIDAAAITENVRRLTAEVAPAAVMVVVKADGYGHGALTAARSA